MKLTGWTVCVLMSTLALMVATAAEAGPVIGQIDTFEDGTTQGWTVNVVGMGSPPPEALPTNIPDGGPGGAGDHFLLLTSLGVNGSGGRLSVLNADSRWTGDYIAAGVNAIIMDLNNLSTIDLALRLVFEDPTTGPPENVAFSSDPILLPAGSGWTRVTFLIDPAHLTSGLGSVTSALTGTTAIRLYHSPTPNFPNPLFPIPAIAAQLGVDNIQAAAVPEPATLAPTALGLIGLAWAIGRRRATGRRAA